MAETTFPIVGVGASAGGIEAFTTMLKSLPETPGLAIVFVLHQDPKHKSILAEVIARSSKMAVELIADNTRVEVDRVYVAPPNAELSIENSVLHLHARTPGAKLIDAFLRSLAEDQGSRAISIVLSGSASDGALGTKEVKAEGGITFVQDDTARVESMPHAAVASGFVDFVLPPSAIAGELLRIARHDYIRKPMQASLPERDLKKLYTLVRKRHDIDFTQYKPATIERRIRRRMALRKVERLDDYVALIRDEPEEIEHLYSDILIKVTGFFRDPAVFTTLARDILPEMLRERDPKNGVRIWVPGCARGDEVYSLAISILETAPDGKFSIPVRIFGTDISDTAIEAARAGLYPQSIAGEVSPERLRRFFTEGRGGFQINRSVRDLCLFTRHNVTKDPPFSRLDLISCRNVMIYFGAALQRRVISIFNYALRPDGFLLLGSSETIGGFADLFAVVDRKYKIYRKKTVVPRPKVHFEMAKSSQNPERSEPESKAAAPDAVFREADRALLSRLSPAGVLINENLDVLQFRGRTSRYLEPPTGAASFNLLKMTRPGLLPDLRAAIQAARKKNAPNRRDGVRVKVDGHSVLVNVEVIPFAAASKERFMLVLFEEPAPEKKGRGRKTKAKLANPLQTARLKRELEATREYLQTFIEEQEAMSDELRSANEEIQSNNEDLQSTNEELETAKEELQSTNEELTTLNEEIANRNQELSVLNNDLVNLLSSVEIPIIMLDSNLRIRRVNPIAQRKFNLADADVGRLITDINTKLPLENLERLVSEVLESREVREVEMRDSRGRVQSLRIRPYLTTDNKIDGAVLVLIDVEEFRRKGAGMQSG